MLHEYIATYAFELKEPTDTERGGYGELSFTSDKPVETAEDWKEVAHQCFQQGDGTYSKVVVTRIGEILPEGATETNTVISGEIIE